MFIRIFALVTTSFLIFSACAQTEENHSTKQNHNLPSVEQLLPARTYTVTIMDKIHASPRFMILSQKFQEAARKNPEQFLQLQKEAAATENGLGYDPRMGLSKNEYDELQTLIDKHDMRVESSGSDEVTVSNSESIIRFSAHGKLTILNNIWIDLINNEVHMDEYILPFTDTISVDGSDNAYGTSWSGYRWEYNSPDSIDFNVIDISKLSTINMTQFKLIVGKLDNTGKPLVQLKGQQIEKGVKILSFETPLFF